MEIISTVTAMQNRSMERKIAGQRIGFVPTMGYLHEGHLSLVRYARDHCDFLVVSIFVNPKQFGPKEDLAQYPRDTDRDLGLLRPLGVDAVFMPPAEEIYPPGFQTNVEVTEVTRGLCGSFRPEFFPGVTTVVLKLFNIVLPDLAVFGEKDFQQLIAIKRMVTDLHLPIEVEGRPIVRETDGLAMSSRNTYLSPEERTNALSLYGGLQLAKSLVEQGHREADRILPRVREFIEQRLAVQIQYVELVDTRNMLPVERIEGEALLALAVFVGKTRLIDNIRLL